MSYIVIDIGGTKTRVGISDDLNVLQKVVSYHTPNNFREGIEAIKERITELKKTKKIKGIAVGIRGPLLEDRTGIANDSVLTAWIREPLVPTLEKIFKVPVFIENDTALAGLGEAHYGAGKGIDIVAYHTVSTGVGGVKVEYGKIDVASSGFEPGHQVLDIDRTILGADIAPTLENLVSGSGLQARVGVKPYEIPQEDIIWDELAEYLAQGLRNTVFYWSPDAIILGGSMIIGDPKIPLEAIRKYTVEALGGFVTCPFITTATLLDEAGLYGAMALLRDKLDLGRE